MAEVVLLQAPRPDGRPGAPAVVGHRPARPGKTTILLYAHYDVQPVALAQPPFEAVERDGRLWGRGADNKAGVLLHVAALRSVLRVLGDELGVGVTVFIDGEEEAGSPSLPLLLQEHPTLLNADVMVVADSGNWQVGVPALATSLRGLILGTIEVRVLEHPACGHLRRAAAGCGDGAVTAGRHVASRRRQRGCARAACFRARFCRGPGAGVR